MIVADKLFVQVKNVDTLFGRFDLHIRQFTIITEFKPINKGYTVNSCYWSHIDHVNTRFTSGKARFTSNFMVIFTSPPNTYVV